ncbi:hypothetical protein IRZ71_09185 [Flavobacterium sp. ANB]|uniref:hypothetical protein n=1 Tax=unclassified Flavobacterium TaxID=196869 RepID=UPI0012B789C3|nr:MULTISPECIES: hypothetical protein [unclassified Flavobacterium]MBF4516517.1 hypothetical protein [Flavobacterium sp. ANB]MTD69586.1 hypothetical protein [Flavobacterium sp. LC2016-13]
MKQKILTLLILLFSISNNAQKIKIDKGEIKLDEKIVGYIEGKKPIFTIYNLDKTYAVTAEVKTVPNEPSLTLPWIELKDQTTGKLNEMDFKSRKFSAFNYDRSIIYELLERNFFTNDGLNKETIEGFVNGESAGISEKRLGVQNEINQANKVADTYQLTIDDAGVIYSIKAKNQDPLDKRIGYIEVTLPATNGEVMYEVMDLDNYLIGTWFGKGGTISGYNKFLNQELITFDKKVLKVAFDNSGNPIGYKMSKDITAMNIVRVLIGNSYTLQHQGKGEVIAIRAEQAKVTEEKIKTERSNSANIYEQNGFVINEKSEKKSGPITAEFQSIKSESSSGMADMTAYGKTVVLKFTNEKGREKTETFKSKNGVRFCIDKGGSEGCYLGLKTIGNTLGAAGSLNSLSFDFSSFYKILYEQNGYMVLVDPLLLSDFILKVPTQEKGLYTNKSSDDKLKKNVAEYLKCDSIVFENYDFKTLEGLIKVLEDYKNNCSK